MFKRSKKRKTCCEKCQNYWTCEEKWFRGEKQQENECCEACASYQTCWGKSERG